MGVHNVMRVLSVSDVYAGMSRTCKRSSFAGSEHSASSTSAREILFSSIKSFKSSPITQKGHSAGRSYLYDVRG